MPVSAATFDVTRGDWGDDSTVNSFAWAIKQANTTPGADVIRLFCDVNVDLASPIEPVSGFLTELTDTSGLRIEGNNHSLVGNPLFITSNGDTVDKNFPRRYSSTGGDQLQIGAMSFARVANNVSNGRIDKLVVDGLNAFLDVGKGSVATITNSTIKNLVAFGYSPRAALTAQANSVINLTEVVMHKLNPYPVFGFGAEFLWDAPAILGENATLNVLKSQLDPFLTSHTGGALNCAGGVANIVSSTILGQGLSISGSVNQGVLSQGVLNVVNSILRPAAPETTTARIQAFGDGVANVIASTLQYDAFNSTIPDSQFCPNLYPCNGAPLQVFANVEIRLKSSAISVLNEGYAGIQLPYSRSYDPQTGAPPAGSFLADQYSYVQPVNNQDSASLKALFNQPNLLTSGLPYTLGPSIDPFVAYSYLDLPGGAYPKAFGPLVDVIPDADSLNQLINPIDGSVISTDVFGNPRTYNGRRDVGAVQSLQPAASVPGPLPLIGLGSAFGWSRRLRRRLGQRSCPH